MNITINFKESLITNIFIKILKTFILLYYEFFKNKMNIVSRI